MPRAVAVLASLGLAMLSLSGCALLAAPALGSAATGGAGALVQAGASSVKGGTVYRTLEAPVDGVYAAVERTLTQLDFPDPELRTKHERLSLRTAAIDRRVQIDLQPITPTLTQVSVTVAAGVWHKDPATATTLMDLIAEAVGPPATPVSRSAP